jgi:predicted nucleotidyltransferase
VNENILKSNKEFSVLGNMNDGDIAALAFLVIMQASKDAENDMKQIMDNVKQTNNAKAQQRVFIEKNKKLKDSLHGNSEIKNNSDNLNDMTEMQQLRLQMYMDRRQKAMETISNLMKKIADTESSIIQNLK